MEGILEWRRAKGRRAPAITWPCSKKDSIAFYARVDVRVQGFMWHREIMSKPFTLNFKVWHEQSEEPKTYHKVHSANLQRTIDRNFFIIWLQDFGHEDGFSLTAGE